MRGSKEGRANVRISVNPQAGFGDQLFVLEASQRVAKGAELLM